MVANGVGRSRRASAFEAAVDNTPFAVALLVDSSVEVAFAADSTSAVGGKLGVVAFVPASLGPCRGNVDTQRVDNHKGKEQALASDQDKEEMLLVELLDPLASGP